MCTPFSCPPPDSGRTAQADDELPKPEEIEVEFQDLYRHDEEQGYLTLMSQEIKSINFPCEENYTVRLCVRFHPFTQCICAVQLLLRRSLFCAERAGCLSQPGYVSPGLLRASGQQQSNIPLPPTQTHTHTYTHKQKHRHKHKLQRTCSQAMALTRAVFFIT